jgi:ABC-2 type transport system ATP-binding protein
MAVAKRPELLILDEPVASLDPLARREFLQHLAGAVADQDLSVLLSSHLVADLERVCDYVIVLVASRVRLAGDVEQVLAGHHRLTGRTGAAAPAGCRVIAESHAGRHTTLIVRSDTAGAPGQDCPGWTVRPVSLEDIILAYMRQTAGRLDRRPALEVTK